ncbi:MAG: DUF4445 domain-containing protein [Clostridia bacterium]|jgi:uncharacterized 2Fe-2S/4Fe-4S cluster protein (DUF4445 family)|nr:DUF4445 domain-containing protein [Clostridia bacterium]
MPKVTFKPSGITMEMPSGSPLLASAKEHDVSVDAPCGGQGTCGKCLVKIEQGKVDFDNSGILTQDLVDEGYVLICKSNLGDEDVVVHVFSEFGEEEGKFSHASEDMLLIDRALMPKHEDIEPLVKKKEIVVSEAEVGDGLSDYDRLKTAVLSALDAQYFELPVNVLQTMPNELREEDGKVTVSYYIDNGVVKIVDVEAGDTIFGSYGVAVDIGTTSVAVRLIYMPEGNILAAKTDYNAQISCGLDVISRINYAKKLPQREELRQKVLGTINELINEMAERSAINANDIYNASIAGNTTMMHLLLGIDPENIRLDPYTPAVYDIPFYKASDVGLNINVNTAVYMAPSVGSYMGGDITSGLLCTSLSNQNEQISLFIDIGTNGELILGNEDFLIGCACSAGPAFEGGGIEHGMRASQGAIERVSVDPDTGVCEYGVIGEIKPLGICGSGMIALIAELFNTGWLDAGGKLNRQRKSVAVEPDNRNSRYIIAPGEETEDGKPIFINETDIDNLVRAKAAIYSACRVMLQKIDMDFEDLEKIYIAGGFGRYIDISKSSAIGLLPNLAPSKFSFIGNSSIIGAYMTLVSKKHIEKQKQIEQNITYLDLSVEHAYMDQYTAALFIPHTDSDLFK